MEDRFNHVDMNNEKVDKIINCAFEEFSKNKFEKASIKKIAKQAGISKGFLYFYFSDKKELFEFLVIYSSKVIGESMEQKICTEEINLLNRIRQGIIVKYEVTERYPYLIRFYQQIGCKKNKREY
jgi:AcrR family transcriptional regulator